MKILLAVDGSECSDAAVTEIARRPWPGGSEVRIFSAAELPVRLMASGDVLPPSVAEDLEQAARAQAESAVAHALAIFREPAGQEMSVTTAVVVDSARDAILDEADVWSADLIVVGSHGYRGYKRFLLGSVSQAIATQAKCSVEIVRARRADDDDS
ncbi:MAG: universal stress protein [Acidobacteriota bacterium]